MERTEMRLYCELCQGTLQKRTTISKNGASLSLCTCSGCGAIYALFVVPTLQGGYGLFRFEGDGQWEKVYETEAEEVMVV
jgi:hypothetical protein